MLDATTTILFILRWIHFIAGIIWIGHLYFFNFVNLPFQAKLGGEEKKKVNPELLPRALFFFRWGAMVTFAVGWLYLLIKYFGPNAPEVMSDTGLMGSVGGKWIAWGSIFGSVMWFNVWFVIWPAQKQIIPAVKAGNPPPAGLPQRAAKFSKINTFLSFPMLFMMGAGAGFYPVFNWPTLIVVVLVGFGVAQALYKISAKVQGM